MHPGFLDFGTSSERVSEWIRVVAGGKQEHYSGMDELATLLRQRVDIIGDHAFRDRDPDGHLDALKDISENIMALHSRLRDAGQLKPRLEHFLANCSYDKALAFIEEAADRR